MQKSKEGEQLVDVTSTSDTENKCQDFDGDLSDMASSKISQSSTETIPIVFIFNQPLLEKHFKKHITVS